jgi:hypothetical protein
VVLEGSLQEDFFQASRYILNNTGVEIKLYRSRQPFVCMSDDTNVKTKLVVQDASFRACYVEVLPPVISAHGQALKEGNALYPYVKADILSFSLAKGSLQMNIDNIFSGACPTKVIVGLIDSEAFSGNYQLNPFNFKFFGITEIQLLVDGVSTPSRPLKIAAESADNGVASAMASLLDTIDAGTDSVFGNDISLKNYVGGYGLIGFHVYGGGGTSGAFTHPKRAANLRLEATFSSALTKAVTVIVYGEFNALLEIDAARNVFVK